MADQLPKLVDQFVKDGETIEQLRVRIAHLQTGLAAQTQRGDAYCDRLETQALKMDALTADNQRLRADAERMAWLEVNGCGYFDSDEYAGHGGKGKWFCWSDMVPKFEPIEVPGQFAAVIAEAMKCGP